MKTFDEIVRAVVEGQVSSFINDHPEVLDTGTTTWKTPRNKTRKAQIKDSIAKRIVRDLTCPDTKAKLILSLQSASGDEASDVEAGHCA